MMETVSGSSTCHQIFLHKIPHPVSGMGYLISMRPGVYFLRRSASETTLGLLPS